MLQAARGGSDGIMRGFGKEAEREEDGRKRLGGGKNGKREGREG